MTTTPLPILSRAPSRDSPVDDNEAEEMLRDLIKAEAKDSEAASDVIGSDDLDLDVDNRAFDDTLLEDKLETERRYPGEDARVITVSGEPTDTMAAGLDASDDYGSVIQEAAEDTKTGDDFDSMMEQAGTENGTLADFEDALWEEDIDLLNPPEEAKVEKKKTPPLLPTTKESKQSPIPFSKFKGLLERPKKQEVSQGEINRLLARFYELERISPRKISQVERDKMALAKDSPSEFKVFLQTGIQEYEEETRARIQKQESPEARPEAKAEDGPEESPEADPDPRGPYLDLDKMQEQSSPPFNIGDGVPPPSYEKSTKVGNLFKTKEAPTSTGAHNYREVVDESGGIFSLFGKKRFGKKRGRGEKDMHNARR